MQWCESNFNKMIRIYARWENSLKGLKATTNSEKRHVSVAKSNKQIIKKQKGGK